MQRALPGAAVGVRYEAGTLATHGRDIHDAGRGVSTPHAAHSCQGLLDTLSSHLLLTATPEGHLIHATWSLTSNVPSQDPLVPTYPNRRSVT